MAKTGLTHKILTRLELNWESYNLAAESKEVLAHKSGLQETHKILKEVAAARDITLALSVEQIFLHDELAKYANSPEEANSIKTALDQLTEARKSFAVVQNPQSYQAVAETYSPKRKEAGLPIDSFREFLKSHSTRLTNRMASQLSVPEKNILRQRKENLGMVKEVYMGMQREALGLEAPSVSRSRGLELGF